MRAHRAATVLGEGICMSEKLSFLGGVEPAEGEVVSTEPVAVEAAQAPVAAETPVAGGTPAIPCRSIPP